MFCLTMSCATKPKERPLTITEQMVVDTDRAQSLVHGFEQSMVFIKNPAAEKFLTSMARQVNKDQTAIAPSSIRVEIHQDRSSKEHRFFSFPGTVISIPESFLVKVEFENELAAALSYELANVLNRNLAIQVDALNGQAIRLFGDGSVFDLSQGEREDSIRKGTELLYLGGYDPRGMASIFQRYAEYYASPTSGSFKKQVDLNVREAQRAKSQYLPSLKPIVRSGEFIQFKKAWMKRK